MQCPARRRLHTVDVSFRNLALFHPSDVNNSENEINEFQTESDASGTKNVRGIK